MTDNVLNAYAEQFKVWPAKFVGSKPTAEQLSTYHKLGARHGLQCLAGAMALRDNGVTGAEIVMACGNPQLNKMRGYITDALVKRVPMPKRNGHEVYKLVVTPKGLQRIKQAEVRAAKLEAEGNKAVTDKPAKAAGKPKGTPKVKRADKVPAIVKPASDAPSVTVTAPAIEADQPQA
jgi:hypothetical protein